MPLTEEKLREQIRRLEDLRDQAKTAVNHVLNLLEKADERRLHDREHSWNKILDNLEHALAVARSRFTSYEQQIKERQRLLQALLRRDPTSAAYLEEALAAEGLEGLLPEDFHLPKGHAEAAQDVLTVPLDRLGQMTLDEVANMHEGMFVADAGHEPVPAHPADAPKKSHLDERIERAKQVREALVSIPQRTEPSFAERRRHKLMRDAVGKVIAKDIKSLIWEETELLIETRETLAQRAEKTPNDARLLSILDEAMPNVEERISELRRKRAQQYTRRG